MEGRHSNWVMSDVVVLRANVLELNYANVMHLCALISQKSIRLNKKNFYIFRNSGKGLAFLGVPVVEKSRRMALGPDSRRPRAVRRFLNG